MSDLTLFHSPNSCSEGIALLLRVIGTPHEVRALNLAKGEQKSPDFLALNPKGKVPSLMRPDGSVLTEFTAIAFWLARTYPDAGLIGDGAEAQARALEILDFIVASLHMRGFTFLKVPQKFLADAEGQAGLRVHGLAEIEKGLAVLSDMLGDQPFLTGRFGIADAAAFYVLRWAEQEEVPTPANLVDLLRRLEALG